jgi:type I restriction enzyme S subunit
LQTIEHCYTFLIMENKQNIPSLRFPEFKGEWEIKKIGEIGEIVTGSTPSTSNQGFYNGNYLFVSPFDINGSRWLKQTKTTLTLLGFSKGRKVRSGSSLFVCIGSTIGKVAQNRIECISNQQINSVIPINNDDNFVYSLLENHSSRIKMMSAEQAVPIINKTTFSGYKLSVPTLPEQQKIANFLTAVDDKLQALKQKKSLLEQYKKGVMQQIFSQELRFKDDNGNDFADWEGKKLGEIANKKSSNISANKIEENFGEHIIYGASGILKKVDFYKEENDYVSIVKDGAGVGRLLFCKGKSSVLGTMEIIRPNEGIDTYFLYCLLSNIDFVKYITGSTIPHIYFKDYSVEICGLPCLIEQTKIANFLSAIDEKINHCQLQIEKTEVWKKGLLQGMFV